MKKCLSLFLALALALGLLAPAAALGEGKLKVVVTIFPIYDWVCQIAGPDLADVTMLLDTGADLHNFQPTVQDILRVAQCDVFIFVGGESDGWTDSVIATANNPALRALNLMEALGERVKEEEIVEGMQAEEEEEEEGPAGDEHIWLSLQNADALVAVIANSLSEADPAHADLYQANAAAYQEQLRALDEKYREAVDAAAFHTILFGDRFPFRYLADDYGLTYYAAFQGCSAETEASFQTILFLAQKVEELGLPAVLTIENPKTRMADTIISSVKTHTPRLVAMDSMQSVTSAALEDGTVSYLGLMEKNLEALKDALN